MSVNVVFGAGGPTGLECVKRLLAVTEQNVRAVVRDPNMHGDKLQTAAGNAFESSFCYLLLRISLQQQQCSGITRCT